MKIGTVRRIDDLGRIVIPKEIRRELRIKSGDNLEIFLEEKNIILKKYSELSKLEEIEKAVASVLKDTIKGDILITDNDKFIIISGREKQKYLNNEIKDELLKIINNRQMYIEEQSRLYLTQEKENIIINPIITKGDIIGSIIVLTKQKIDNNIIKVVTLLTNLLIKYIEYN